MKSKTDQKLQQNLIKGLSKSLENWDNISNELRAEILQNILLSLDQQKYPFYENDSKVILIYKGDAHNVALLSDITGWTDPIQFKKLNDINLFFLALELESEASIQYQLIVDGNDICDPSNKFKSLYGLGALSEFVMPKYQRHPYLKDYLYGKEGSYQGLIKHILPSGALPYDHEVHVYLPPNYSQMNSYPTVYFHDGPDYIKYALAPYSINRLIVENKIEPCIAVFVTPPNMHQPAEPNRSTEYGMNDDYVKFFCDELVNFIDKNYSTIRSAGKRLIIGDSFAGLISTYISFLRNDIFQNAYSQSGYFSFKDDSIIKLIRDSAIKPINLFVDIGTYEKKVGADFLPVAELDFLNANRRMKKVLTEKGYNFIYKEYFEGHTWGNWRRHLIDGLIYFFGVYGEPK
ncbi:MAG: alpha/beta hydrolase-fold protein [Ignavibacteriales bacterium]|nr:alpha/beta hydrolase-fold protein [Ignavibacteriales bacterium]